MDEFDAMLTDYAIVHIDWPDTQEEVDQCIHEFVDARNEYVASGELCVRCGAIRAGNLTRKERDGENNSHRQTAIGICYPRAQE